MLTKTTAKLKVIPWDGKPIRFPGVYSGIPLSDYHSADICIEPSISSSGLRKIYNPCPWVKASPAHFWCQSVYNPECEEDPEEDNKSLILGRAAHHLLFGEKQFSETFVLRPTTVNGEAWHGNKTVCKIWAQRQADAGKTVISPDQLKAIKGIARELWKEPLVRQGLLNGDIECSWFWKHPLGVWLKIRPDASPNDSLDFVDLKLSKSIMWPDIQRAIRDYGYFIQAGLVAMGIKAVTGQPMNSFSLVFCENTAPHCIEIVTLKDNEIARGIAACQIAIGKFNKCWQEKRWPGPRGNREDAQFIEFSAQDQKRIDEALATEEALAMEQTVND